MSGITRFRVTGTAPSFLIDKLRLSWFSFSRSNSSRIFESIISSVSRWRSKASRCTSISCFCFARSICALVCAGSGLGFSPSNRASTLGSISVARILFFSKNIFEPAFKKPKHGDLSRNPFHFPFLPVSFRQTVFFTIFQFPHEVPPKPVLTDHVPSSRKVKVRIVLLPSIEYSIPPRKKASADRG